MTALTRRNPFDDLASWWPRDLFARFGTPAINGEWSPRCDVEEDDKSIIVHAELPGVEAKNMEVNVNQGMLTIRGEKQTEKKEEKNGGYSERFFGSFERSLSIPANVDEEKIEANLKDGVLEVRLPKSEPSPPPSARNVEIKSA
ncbi:MAG: Hsp20/alpha crystallin family protein [Dehalococcoidia bacterium]